MNNCLPRPVGVQDAVSWLSPPCVPDLIITSRPAPAVRASRIVVLTADLCADSRELVAVTYQFAPELPTADGSVKADHPPPSPPAASRLTATLNITHLPDPPPPPISPTPSPSAGMPTGKHHTCLISTTLLLPIKPRIHHYLLYFYSNVSMRLPSSFSPRRHVPNAV